MLILIISTFQINAGEIDFTDEAGNNLITFQQVIQGTDLSAGAVGTFMNPIVDSGTNDFFNISNGLALGTGGLGSSWEVVFDRTVDLNSYTIDYSDAVKPFDITGSGVNLIGLSNAPGTVTPATPITFLDNEVYTFTLQPSVPAGGLTFSLWSFDPVVQAAATPVPFLAPISLILLVVSLGFMGFIGLRYHFDEHKT